MRRRRALLCLLIAAGCAELRRPPSPEPPAELTGGAALRPAAAVLEAAMRRFAAPEGLPAGQPAEMALALARLEWLGGAAAAGGPLSGLPESDRASLRLAVQEARAAFGLAPDVAPDRAVAALLAARAALLRADRAAASAALAPPVFRAVPPPPLARLEAPPPLPSVAMALAGLAPALERERDRESGLPALLDHGRTSPAGFGVPMLR